MDGGVGGGGIYYLTSLIYSDEVQCDTVDVSGGATTEVNLQCLSSPPSAQKVTAIAALIS